MKVKLYKRFKLFKWVISIKIPDFINPWELSGEVIHFTRPPNKNEIVHLEWIKNANN